MKKVKNIIGRLISHNISLFGGKFILGQSYQPELGKKWCSSKSWKMSYYSLNLGILTISIQFSHDGVHEIHFCSTLTNSERSDKIEIDFQDQNIEHTWRGKDHAGNSEYRNTPLYDWAHYNEFGTRVKKA